MARGGPGHSCPMDLLPSLVAGVAGLAFGWLAAGRQHLLYAQDEYRADPLAGSRLRRYRIGLAFASGLACAIAFRPGHYDAGPALLSSAFVLALALVSSTDFERRIIPNRVSYPAIIAAAAFCWAWPDRSIADVWLGAGFAATVGIGLFALGLGVGAVLGVSATPFGLGDVKLILLIGLLTGWPAVTAALFLGVVAAGVPSAILLFSGGAKKVFSYGPYLAIGAAVVLLWPERFA